MYRFPYSIKMFDTDASGFLFFTSQMRMAHEAYESFMESSGLGIAHILRASDYLLPIVHAETTYAASSSAGDEISIEITAERVGKTSFTLSYRFLNSRSEEVGTASTVHVAMDKATKEKRPLPEPVRKALAGL